MMPSLRTRSRRWTATRAAAWAVAGGLGALMAMGCAPYVNIPPQRGDVARNDIDAGAIRTITIPAVRAVVEQRPPAGPYVVSLIEADENLTYPEILPEIGPNALAPFDDARPPDAPVYEVTGIRIRGLSGEVDVVAPGDYGGRQLLTVYLRNPPFSPWTVERLRVWRGPVEQTPPPTPAAAPAPAFTPAGDPPAADHPASEADEAPGDDA